MWWKVAAKPANGATLVRSLSPKTVVTVLESEGGWLLIASQGRPIGYVATRNLVPGSVRECLVLAVSSTDRRNTLIF
ncbi:MAG: SH3 domain-containing protein [Afipia birgiae]|nr:SH3 domain-containing protein [Afipia birgiae]